jgi:hypothetical protein
VPSENFLTQKTGPLPNWAYGAIAGGGLVLYRWWKNRQAGSSSSSSGAVGQCPSGYTMDSTGTQCVPLSSPDSTVSASLPGGGTYQGPASGLSTFICLTNPAACAPGSTSSSGSGSGSQDGTGTGTQTGTGTPVSTPANPKPGAGSSTPPVPMPGGATSSPIKATLAPNGSATFGIPGWLAAATGNPTSALPSFQPAGSAAANGLAGYYGSNYVAPNTAQPYGGIAGPSGTYAIEPAKAGYNPASAFPSEALYQAYLANPT